MAREQKFDIISKPFNQNHQLSIGWFPDEFLTKSKNWVISSIQNAKENEIVAAEEVPKIKKSIKEGKVVEEQVGSQINQYKGKVMGGQTGKFVLFAYQDKSFRAIPIDNWYDFKKIIR